MRIQVCERESEREAMGQLAMYGSVSVSVCENTVSEECENTHTHTHTHRHTRTHHHHIRSLVRLSRTRERTTRQLLGNQSIRAHLRGVLPHREGTRQCFGGKLIAKAGHVRERHPITLFIHNGSVRHVERGLLG